jgi:hypothetical protein
MQPGNVDVRVDARGEAQVHKRRGGDRGMKMERALGMDAYRRFARQCQDHGNIVGRETPEDILLAPHFAQIQAVGIYVAQAAKRALAHQRMHLQECGMILQQVADHQHEAALFGLGD